MTPAQRALIEHIKHHGLAWRMADGRWCSGLRKFKSDTVQFLLNNGTLEVKAWNGSGSHLYPVRVALRDKA